MNNNKNSFRVLKTTASSSSEEDSLSLPWELRWINAEDVVGKELVLGLFYGIVYKLH